MTEIERGFKGIWIPAEVWLDQRLSAIDKVILAEIDSLDIGDRGCYASNKHIAEFSQCSEATVTRAVSKLIDYGYLKIKNFDGRQRVLRSLLNQFDEADLSKRSSGPIKLTKRPNQTDEAAPSKCRESNIDSNIDSNNIYTPVVEFLNKKAGTKFKASSAKTKAVIRARQNEGYTLEDFYAVIDKKCAEWMGTTFQKYLRPETLFGTKFESYLNADAGRSVGHGECECNSGQAADKIGIYL